MRAWRGHERSVHQVRAVFAEPTDDEAVSPSRCSYLGALIWRSRHIAVRAQTTIPRAIVLNASLSAAAPTGPSTTITGALASKLR